jgi:AraC-like DNA-binding protein
MDILTDVLHAIRLEGRLSCDSEFTAPWEFAVSAVNGMSFAIVKSGLCWLRLHDASESISLATGDLVVLLGSSGYTLVDRPQSDAVGTSAALTCGEFFFQHGGAHPLFSQWPSLIHIKSEQGQPVEWLKIWLGFIKDEEVRMQPGRETIINRLIDVLFVMVMRYWVDHYPTEKRGWLGALYDAPLAAALDGIHSQPAHAWTVDSLAMKANLSRSAFAAKFNAWVGESPMKYLTRWRMQLAMNWLRAGTLSLDDIAERVGYGSAYAFGKTFKRVVGTSPGEYRKG